MHIYFHSLLWSYLPRLTIILTSCVCKNHELLLITELIFCYNPKVNEKKNPVVFFCRWNQGDANFQVSRSTKVYNHHIALYGNISKKHGCLTVAKRQKSFWVDIDKHVPARFVTCCGYLKHFRCGLCVFAACFCIWLCCAYLQHVSVFGCVVRIAARFYIWLCY